MFKKLTSLSLMFAATLFAADEAVATRGNDAPVVTMTSTGDASGTIEVISTDGKKWNEIKSSALNIPTGIYIKNPSGYVVGYKIGIMGPTAAHEVFTPNKPTTFQKTMTLGSTDSEFNLVFKNEIIELCNDQLSRRNGLAETHNVSYDARVSLIAWLGWDGVEVNDAISRNMNVSVPVKCIKSEYITPWGLDLHATQHGKTCPKKTEVRAFIKYDYPATAKFRFRVDGKLSELQTVNARRLTKPQPGMPGADQVYGVEHVKTYYLDPGEHSFSIEVRGGEKSRVITLNSYCPPFKVTESWLKYKVQNTSVCPKNVKEVATFKATRPGTAPFEIKTQGGLVVNSGTATFERKGREYVATVKRNVQMSAFESYMSAQITDPTLTSAGSGTAHLKVECLEYSGDFSFIDNTGTRCPREGKTLVNFSMNIKKNIHYKLDCSHGNFSGVAQAVPGNNGGFVAPALVKFNIPETTHANCRLSSRVAGQTKIHTLKGHVFKCIRRTTDPVSGDLSGGNNPTPTAPTTPDVLVANPETPLVPPSPPVNVVPGIIADPVRTVSCENGVVRNRSCFCPRTHKKLSVGPNAFRCEKSVAGDPIRTNGNSGTPGASTETGPVGGAPGTSTDASSAGGKPTRANPAAANTASKNPDAEKRRLEELKKKQQAQKKAAAAKKKAAAAKKKAAAAAKKKAATAARKKAAAAKKAAIVAKQKAAAPAKQKAAAAAKKKAAAAAKKKNKKKGKKKGRRAIAG